MRLAVTSAVAVTAVLGAAGGGGCSAALDFDECDVDADCAKRAAPMGPVLYCTDKHMCIDPSPCTVSVRPNPTLTGKPIIIGGLYRLTIDNAASKSILFRHASDLAAMQINTEGTPVTHIACDTAGDPARAQAAYRLLAELFHAVAVVGPDTSDELISGVGPVVAQYKIPVISPGATSSSITSYADGGLIWRTAPSDDLQSAVLAQIVPATPTDTLDLVSVDSSYAAGLAAGFLRHWTGVVETSISFKSGDVAGAVARMGSPKNALLIADSDAPALLQAVRAAPNLAATQFFMTEGAVGPNLWGDAPYNFTFLGRFRGTAPGLKPADAVSGPIYNAFHAAYVAAWTTEEPNDTAFVASAYDSFFSITLATAAAGDDRSGAAIVANLGRLSSSGARSISVGPGGFGAALGELVGGRDVNLQGASGPIDFDALTGDVRTAPISIWNIKSDATGKPTFAIASVITP
jgi:branched-chain amino acid transport system substrate-binding protein